jgi:hypothetical protein
MTSRTRSITIAAQPEHVFAILAAFADPPPFATITRTSQNDGCGAVYEVRGRAYGARFRHLFMIDTYTPPRTLTFSSVGRHGVWWRVAYLLEPHTTGTTLTAAITVQTHGTWRILQPILGHTLNKATHDALTRARTHAEHPTTTNPAAA